MRELRANTQVKVVIGPALDIADGLTPVTNLTLSGADEAELMKHDASAVTSISGNTIAAITSMDGYYNVTLTASNLDTKGMLLLAVNDDSLILPIKEEFMVLDEGHYDAKYGPSRIAGTATTGSSQTSVVTSAFGLSVAADDLVGRTIVFLTGDAAGCASDITANTSGATPTLTITQIATTVASGDTFIVI